MKCEYFSCKTYQFKKKLYIFKDSAKQYESLSFSVHHEDSKKNFLMEVTHNNNLISKDFSYSFDEDEKAVNKTDDDMTKVIFYK